jgi:PIN domain nuclease of toxin-antitoxin system
VSSARDTYVLDACAVIAFLNGERGAECVRDLLEQALAVKSVLFIHALTVCEVYYDCLRRSGQHTASRVLSALNRLPMVVVRDMDDPLLCAAGRLKVAQDVSLADSFVVALAGLRGARVVTSDHAEFGPLEKSGVARFVWIR